jgi:hypothetical protein
MNKTCATCRHWRQDDKYTGECLIKKNMRRGNENTCRAWEKWEDE